MGDMIPEQLSANQMAPEPPPETTQTATTPEQPAAKTYTEDEVNKLKEQIWMQGQYEAIRQAKERGLLRDPRELEEPKQTRSRSNVDPFEEEFQAVQAIAEKKKDPLFTTKWLKSKLTEEISTGVMNTLAEKLAPILSATEDQVGDRHAEEFLKEHRYLSKAKPQLRKLVEKHNVPIDDLMELIKVSREDIADQHKKEAELVELRARARKYGYTEGSDLRQFSSASLDNHGKLLDEMDKAVKSGDQNKILTTFMAARKNKYLAKKTG